MKVFKAIGKFFARVFGFAVSNIDVTNAIPLIEEAALRFVDNTQRREWAVQQLQSHGIPESIARLIVELALQQVKARTRK